MVAGITLLCSCVADSGISASEKAMALAEKSVVPDKVYAHAAQVGPSLVVLPGHFKSTNGDFSQKVNANNIADYAEIELGKANFKVLERADLGPLLNELTLAVNLGDPKAVQKFRRGKFVSTRWFVEFDILKAEPVAEATNGFDGKAIGNLVTTIAGDSIGGRAAGGLISSVGASDSAKVWIVGIKYKIIDAATSAIVHSKYIEKKMVVGSTDVTVLGIKQAESGGMTIDSMVQMLVQDCVVEIDGLKKGSITHSRSSQVAVPPTDIAAADPPGVMEPPETGPIGETAPFSNVYQAAVEQPQVHTSQQSVNCQELRKTWQLLGEASVMQQYLRECTQ